MSLLLKIGLLLFVLMALNANLIQAFLDRKTRYKKCDIYDQPAILYLFVFFGVFTLPFMNQVKRLRRRMYLKKRLKELKQNDKYLLLTRQVESWEEIENEIFTIERTLKLERLKRKI